MAFPSGLKFVDRIASHEGLWYVQCAAGGHRRMRRQFGTKAAAKQFLREHDIEVHSLNPPTEDPSSDPTVREMLSAFLDHVTEQVADGVRSPETLRGYESSRRMLEEGFGPDTRVRAIDRPAVSAFIRYRRRETDSGGARTVKDLRLLQTAASWFLGAPLPWKIRAVLDEIRPEKRPEMPLDRAIILRWVSHMPPESIERDWAIWKLHSGLREVEQTSLNVGDVDLRGKLYWVKLRNKHGGGGERVSFPMSPEQVEIARRRTYGRGAREPLFSIEGRRLQHTSLRRRYLAASHAAKIHPPITATGKLRSEVLTEIAYRHGLESARQHAKHSTPLVTLQHYVKTRESDDLAARRGFVSSLASAFALESVKEKGSGGAATAGSEKA